MKKDAREKTSLDEKIFGAALPFIAHCGIRPLERGGGKARLEVRLEPHHLNNSGVGHGGLVMTLLDVTMASAAGSATGTNVVTVDMQTAFLAPATGTLTSEAAVVRAGKSIVFVEGRITNDRGDLVAKASCVCKTVKGPAGDG